jgi:hypothetical protein
MNITASSLNQKRNHRLDIIKRSHVKEELRRVQAKIEMANTVGYDQCHYQVGACPNMCAEETSQEVKKELSKRGFIVTRKVRTDGGMILFISWKPQTAPK